jgi:hypothetical protein
VGPARNPAPSVPESSRQSARAQVTPLIDHLEKSIAEYVLEFRKFFGGERQTPPEDLRVNVVQQLRSLRSMTVQGVADSFRLTNLEAQYNTNNELFNRRLRQREEVGVRAARPAAAPAAPPADPVAGIRIDPRLDDNSVAALYRGLYQGAGGADFDRFKDYLKNQLLAIRDKTGAQAVVFRVASEDGKLKLKARPVTEASGE